MLAVINRSVPERTLPDLFYFALLGRFLGYFPGYSTDLPRHLNYLTWAILKAHTENRAGTVTLRSADPRDHHRQNPRAKRRLRRGETVVMLTVRRCSTLVPTTW